MIESLPFFHSYNSTTQRLVLQGASYIPDEVVQYSDAIRILDITGGTVSELPDSFSLLTKLFAVFLGENNFQIFPQVLSQCKNLKIISFKNGILESIPEYSFPESLEWLVFTNNPNLREIPISIGNLGNLQKLALAGTGIHALPDSLVNCKKLEFLRISACQFITIPSWINSFSRLAWFASAGNPGYLKKEILDTATYIGEDDIEVFECLNESNISKVSRGIILSTGKEVAIKVYKNPITSDGYALDDIIASIAIANHPNLISVVGILSRSGDEGDMCLISEFIPSGFKKLGLPPTLESCARDTYENNSVFTLTMVINILTDISSACEYIHSLGISHGDLYAHNILVDIEGHAILTDFGAATFYDLGLNPEYEYYDVCAYGHLMGELLERVEDISEGNGDTKKLSDMQNACIGENIFSRPRFSEIRMYFEDLRMSV